MKEKKGFSINGWIVALLLLVFVAFMASKIFNNGAGIDRPENVAMLIPTFILVLFVFRGLYVIEPNEAIIQMFFGSYVGTDKQHGYRWTIPFFKRTRASLRVQDFETEMIKVNDLNGNPIQISAIVIWRIKDTYAAYFDVEDFGNFLTRQSVAALRGLAMKYPYEASEEHGHSLITHTEEVAENLKVEVQNKLDQAGIEIMESRINHLSYAREIAAAMLQRQQASAIISARTEIVEGAVGMVEMAINQLENKEIVSFTPEDKRKLVTNLLVVLCSEQSTQPIIEAGGA